MTLRVCYGGTFDPVHAGHLAVATAAREALAGGDRRGGEARIDFLPAADPPHRPPPGASAAQRVAMLRLALADRPGFGIDERELRRAGPSWTVTTLRELRAELGPAAPVAWLLGADAFRGLPSWHEWPALFELAHLIVAVRPGHDLARLPADLEQAIAGRWLAGTEGLHDAPAGRLWRLDLALHPASATAVRAGLAAGAVSAWLPPAVASYIADNGLYRGHHGVPGV